MALLGLMARLRRTCQACDDPAHELRRRAANPLRNATVVARVSGPAHSLCMASLQIFSFRLKLEAVEALILREVNEGMRRERQKECNLTLMVQV